MERHEIGRQDALIALLLAGLTLVAYAAVRQYGFVDYDDPTYVADNAIVKRGLTLGGVSWALTTGHASNWHPLTWLSLMLDCQLFAAQPEPMHVHNVLLHTANVCLLFWVLRQLTGMRWPSALAAALFAWHPLRVESVAWIAERKDVLSMLFWLLTLLAWVRFIEQRTPRRYALTLVAFILGLLSKPTVISLPFVLLLLDFWPLQRWTPSSIARVSGQPQPTKKRASMPAQLAWKQLLLEKMPFFALSFVAAVLTFWAQRGGGAMTFGETLTFPQRLTNALVACVEYLRKFVWPSDLAVFYPHPGDWPWWRVAVATAILLLVTVIALWQRRSRPYVLVGWLWYLGTLVPVLGLTQVGGQAFADRYTYVPMVGIAIMVAWGAVDLTARWPTGLRLASAGVVLATCLMLTIAQVRTWQTTLTLFTHALEVTSNNHRAHKEVADVYAAEKRFDDANRHYEEALRIKPRFFGAQMDYAMALGNQRNFQAAIAHLVIATEISPESPEAHNNLGLAYELTGQPDQAIEQYREAVRLRPNNSTAQRNLDRLLARRQPTQP